MKQLKSGNTTYQKYTVPTYPLKGPYTLYIYTVCYRKIKPYANKRRLMQGVMRFGLCARLCAGLCARVVRWVMRMVMRKGYALGSFPLGLGPSHHFPS